MTSEGKNILTHHDWLIEVGAAIVDRGGSRSVEQDLTLRVRGDSIIDIHRGHRQRGGTKLVAHDQFFIPGLISAHNHVSVGNYTRGLIEGGDGTWQLHKIVEQFSDAELKDLIRGNILELLRSGVTTTLNMEHSQRRYNLFVEAASEFNIRSYPSVMVPSVNRLERIWLRGDDDEVLDRSTAGTVDELREALAAGLAILDDENDLIRPQMAIHATDTHTPESLAVAVDGAIKLGTGIHLHLSQTVDEPRRVLRRWGVSPVEWLEKCGVLDSPIFVAHLDYISDSDLQRLSGAKVFYATCPHGWGPGGTPQPWPEALAAGVPSGPAIDTHSNDMIEALKIAVVHGQARSALRSSEIGGLPCVAPTINDALDGCTRVIADALGRPDLGRIAVGAKADLVGVDVCSAPVGAGAVGPRPLWQLMYANSRNVKTVITNGFLQIVGGTAIVCDEIRLNLDVRTIISKLYARLSQVDGLSSDVWHLRRPTNG